MNVTHLKLQTWKQQNKHGNTYVFNALIPFHSDVYPEVIITSYWIAIPMYIVFILNVFCLNGCHPDSDSHNYPNLPSNSMDGSPFFHMLPSPCCLMFSTMATSTGLRQCLPKYPLVINDIKRLFFFSFLCVLLRNVYVTKIPSLRKIWTSAPSSHGQNNESKYSSTSIQPGNEWV